MFVTANKHVELDIRPDCAFHLTMMQHDLICVRSCSLLLLSIFLTDFKHKNGLKQIKCILNITRMQEMASQISKFSGGGWGSGHAPGPP